MICNWSALRGSLLRRRHFSVLGGAGPRLIMVVFTFFSLTCARPGRVECSTAVSLAAAGNRKNRCVRHPRRVRLIRSALFTGMSTRSNSSSRLTDLAEDVWSPIYCGLCYGGLG